MGDPAGSPWHDLEDARLRYAVRSPCGTSCTADRIPVPRMSRLRTKLLHAAGRNPEIGAYQQDHRRNRCGRRWFPRQSFRSLHPLHAGCRSTSRTIHRCQLLHATVGCPLTVAQSYQRIGCAAAVPIMRAPGAHQTDHRRRTRAPGARFPYDRRQHQPELAGPPPPTSRRKCTSGRARPPPEERRNARLTAAVRTCAISDR